MPRSKHERLPRKKPQSYDTSFKHWVEQQAQEILPVLLPGAVYEKTLTVEIIRSVMRADKVFKILYCGEEHILHLEFETGSDRYLRSRLLVYNSVLYRDYHLPVITIVIYPFSVEPAVSPLCIKSNRRPILTFRFKTLPLFTLEAEQFVQEHRACMYPLLPTMHGVHAELVAQAMQELAELYRDDEVTLSQQYTWMMLLLERTDTVEPLEKGKIEERLKMFDQLWNESPRVQKMKKQFRELAQKEARQELVKKQQEAEQELAKKQQEAEQELAKKQQEAEQELVRLQKEAEQGRVRLQKEAEQERVRLQKEAEQERVRLQKEAEQERTKLEQELAGLEQERAKWQMQTQDIIEAEKVRADREVKRLRRVLVSVVQARFPDLTEFARQHVELFDKPEVLDLLIQQIVAAPDASTARLILNPSSDVQ